MKTKQRRKKGATIVARQQPRRLDNVYPKMKTTKTRKIKKRGQLVSQKGATIVAKKNLAQMGSGFEGAKFINKINTIKHQEKKRAKKAQVYN